jgi:hypothetical protein
MATIKDTLYEIEQIQSEFTTVVNDDGFIKDITNITTVIYFEYLSHTVLDEARTIDLSSIKNSKKYYKLFSKKDLLSEFIRINNISQLFIVWNVYEQYLRRKYFNEYGLRKFNIKALFDDLINKVDPENKTQIIEEFEVMRNTRNSLHEGGKYNSEFIYYRGNLCDKEYEFIPGVLVKPLRIMDVIKTIWSHYKQLEK